jgi:hypothetical protein
MTNAKTMSEIQKLLFLEARKIAITFNMIARLKPETVILSFNTAQFITYSSYLVNHQTKNKKTAATNHNNTRILPLEFLFCPTFAAAIPAVRITMMSNHIQMLTKTLY